MAETIGTFHSELSSGGIWIIANPIAGGHGARRRLDSAVALLKSRLTIHEIRWTKRRGDAEQWAREAAAHNVALIIGSGGDGTINELANGLAGSEVALGILPAGTANVIACELGIPFDPTAAANCLLNGKIERVNIGRAEYQPLPGTEPVAQRPSASAFSSSSFILHPSSFRFFLFAAGLGFDAYVCHRVDLGLKRWGRKAAYIIAGLRLFLRYQSPRLQVALDGGPPVSCSELIVANIRSYGGRFQIAPDASFHKPDLDACLFSRPGRWNLLRYALGIMRGTHVKYPDVIYRKAQSVEVSTDRPVYLQLDGDTVGTAPARFTVHPSALSVVTPTNP